MNTEDIIYLVLLIFSIAFGYVFRLVHNPFHRQIVSTCAGIAIVIAVSGYHIIHQVFITVVTIVLIQICPKRLCHRVCFVSLFLYLLFFRLCHYFGIPSPPGHSNAVQMMMTLKLVGVCMEIQETWKTEALLKKSEEENKTDIELAIKHQGIHPSAIDIFHYAFSYIGIMTGPYYKYKVFEDAIQGNEALYKKKGLNCLEAVIKRSKLLPLYVIAFLISSQIYPLSFAESEEIFEDYSFMYRVWYLTPTFFIFRMRLYSAFVLSECACVMVGLGAYPSSCKSKPGQGPTDLAMLDKTKTAEPQEQDFKTVYNIDEWGSEFSPTVRGGMRSWNMTVQFWLVSNVYKQLRLPKPAKEVLTMLTSAFWHGVYPGYYLSLMTVPFILAVEDFYDKKIRRNLGDQGKKIYDFFAWILKMQQFSYMGMAFLLLKIDTTLHYWRSIGFLFHGIIALQHAVAQFINLIIGKVEKKLNRASRTSVTADATYTVTKKIDIPHSPKKLQ